MKAKDSLQAYSPSLFKEDFIASIVVFLVAIPLCLGIALASGAPLFSGIISGIIGGIVVGAISQSAVSVSGPAAGMVAVVLAGIAELGGFNTFLLALVFAGCLQVLLGLFRAGFIADYIPSNVIQGLLCAIGILIIIKQLPFLLTYTSGNAELLALLKDISGNLNFNKIVDVMEHINFGAMAIGIISLSILFYADTRKSGLLKHIPGPMIVVVLGTLINEAYGMIAPTLEQSNNELVNIPVSKDLKEFVANFQTPAWENWTNTNVYLYGFMLAAVASLEALLNLEGVEKLDKMRRYTSRSRELVAQGIGNAVSGLIGGLPITSVIVRSSVNMNSGAQTKVSTILHGVWILLVALMFQHWVNAIPLAALAAILIHVGYKLTKPSIYHEMYGQGWSRFLPFIITIVAIITTNLLTGIIVGLIIGFFFILRNNSQIQLDIINEHYPSGEIQRLVLPQHMSFLSKASLVEELESFPPHSKLIIDARYAKYIDRDIQEVLEVFRRTQAPEKHISLNMLGFKDHYEIHDHINFLNVTNYSTQASLTPNEVTAILKEGNKRFVTDNSIHRHLPDEVKASSYTQHPIAIILGCIDSRVPVESIFDMGFGDVFVARVAGNVMNDDIIASMEFACQVAGAKVILVLGHTYCGSIKAACDNVEGGHLTHLLAKIKPAIAAETITTVDRNSDNLEFMRNVTRLNVEHTLMDIRGKSAILTKLIDEGKVGLLGATYDIKTGIVSFHQE